MTEKQKNVGRQADGAVLKAMADMQQTGWMGTAWLEKMSDLGAEWLNFVTERVQEDVKTQHQILHCKDVGELQQIQTAFFEKAVDQYRAETGKIIEMSSAMFTPPDEEKAPAKKHSTPV